MTMKINIHKSIFNKVYLPYLTDYVHRYEVYYGGAGSGKSVFIAQKLIVKALSSKRKVLVMRKVMATVKVSTWQLMLDTLSSFHLLRLCEINKSDFTITLPNGSIFLFRGLDDPEKIKSITGITDVWAEEATEFNLDDVTQLDLRLRALASYLQFYFSFNPTSKANWVYKRWFADEVVVGDDTFILRTTYKDNRFLPDSYIKSLENLIHTNPTYYKIYVLGDFATLDKLVFSNWEERRMTSEEVKGWTPIAGLDFGYTNDPTALVVAYINVETKQLYIHKAVGRTEMTNIDIYNLLLSMGMLRAKIIADCAEPKSIKELRNMGVSRIRSSVKGADSIIHGIQRLHQFKIYVSPDADPIIAEFENYAWKKDRQTNEYIDEPIDAFNHWIDALRYALQCVDEYGSMKTASKAILGI